MSRVGDAMRVFPRIDAFGSPADANLIISASKWECEASVTSWAAVPDDTHGTKETEQ